MKELRSIWIVLILLSAMQVNAQDTIVKRDLHTVPAKIMEVRTNEIRYKRWDNLEGPLYVIPAEEVWLLRYAGGLVDTIKYTPVPVAPAPSSYTAAVFHPIERRDGDYYYQGIRVSNAHLYDLINRNGPDEARALLSEERRLRRMGTTLEWISIPISIIGNMVLIEYVGDSYNANRSQLFTGTVMFVGGAAGAIVGIASKATSRTKLRDAVALYNAKVLGK
jgi:hypothetical protein